MIKNEIPIIFILAAPRTGSTFLYQFLINNYRLGFINNFTNNNFSKFPEAGIVISKLLGGFNKKNSYRSNYGKTKGWHEPSEASGVFRRWYGGMHPSEVYSANPIRPREMTKSLLRMHHVFRSPLVFKNAWNCFRIKDLSYRYPNSFFIWLKRDIGASASSDLMSKYNNKTPYSWNSATTKNYNELFELMPHEQSVEQQFYFNQYIEKNLELYAKDRSHNLWYEDLCFNTGTEIEVLESKISKKFHVSRKNSCIDHGSITYGNKVVNKDVSLYILKNIDRLNRFVYEE